MLCRGHCHTWVHQRPQIPTLNDSNIVITSVAASRLFTLPCRLWFVRMPKPLEETASTASEHELESFKTQVAILNESLNVKRVSSNVAACTAALP